MWWAPRALSVAVVVFLSLVALDVFTGEQSALETLIALAIHLVPVYVVLLTLWVGWKHEWVATLGYAALGITYIVWANPRFPWQTLAVISGPLFLMSALFLASWMTRNARRAQLP